MPDAVAANTKVDEFKYLVSFDRKKKEYAIGMRRTFGYHFQIQDAFGHDYEPDSAGYFRVVRLENGDWDTSSIELYGKSEGFSIYPNDERDARLIKMMLEDGEVTFNEALEPV